MEIKQQIAASDSRNSRLAGIRASLKEVPILKQVTSRIQNKLKSASSILTNCS